MTVILAIHFLIVMKYALCILAFALTISALVIEPKHKEPLGWMRYGEPKPSDPIRLQLALKQKNMDILEKTLLRISDPRESTYGQWLSLPEIAQIIAPSMEELNLVYSWLESFGLVTSF